MVHHGRPSKADLLTTTGPPPEPVSVGLPYERAAFAHNAERQLARLLDFYAVRWEYEPHTFVLATGPDGHPTSAFTPDFWLPDHHRYIEVTTLDQRLVTRKNRKLRQLRALRPDLDVSLIYQRDYLQLLARYGLEPPEQHGLRHPSATVGAAVEPIGLLGLAGPATGLRTASGGPADVA